MITLPAVPAPHAGTSYNPPAVAHTELLRTAHEAELRRVQEAEALEVTKMRILGARHPNGDSGDVGAQGMLIDKPGNEEDGAISEQPSANEPGQDDSAGIGSGNTARRRKTKQQRRKAEKLRAEVRGPNPASPLLPFSRT